MKRKIIQVATTPDTVDFHAALYALCDDGTLWTMSLSGESNETEKWEKIKDIPQE